MIHGIDVSGYQTHIDWKAVASAGADFAIVKLTEGNGYTNPLAARQIDGALEAGLLVMGYHFARPNGPNWNADAIDEASRMLARAGDLFCFLDVERNTPLTSQEIPLWRAWAYAFRTACGGRVGWYSGLYFTAALGLEASWEGTLLWLAKYPLPWNRQGRYDGLGPHHDQSWPDAPLPWARVDIWQDGGGQPVSAGGNDSNWPGVDGGCDVNRFAGSRAELEELISVAR